MIYGRGGGCAADDEVRQSVCIAERIGRSSFGEQGAHAFGESEIVRTPWCAHGDDLACPWMGNEVPMVGQHQGVKVHFQDGSLQLGVLAEGFIEREVVEVID